MDDAATVAGVGAFALAALVAAIVDDEEAAAVAEYNEEAQIVRRPRRRLVPKMVQGGMESRSEDQSFVVHFDDVGFLDLGLPLQDDPHHFQGRGAQEILQEYIDENLFLNLLPGNTHNLYTLFASANRADLVQAAVQHQLQQEGLADLGVATLHSANVLGCTATFYFAQHGNLEGVKLCSLYAADRTQCVLDALAASIDSIGFFRSLLTLLADVRLAADRPVQWTATCPWLQTECNQLSLLQLCCYKDRLEAVRLLLQCGCNQLQPGGRAGSDGTPTYSSCFDICGRMTSQPLQAASDLLHHMQHVPMRELQIMASGLRARSDLPPAVVNDFQQKLQQLHLQWNRERED